MEEYTFENDLQRIAFVHYGHLPSERENLQFILRKITEDNLPDFVETYFNSSQFNIEQKIRELWNQIKGEDKDGEEYPSLNGHQENVLIYLLNMYCCEINKKKRAKQTRY
jgi:hypothetical protein